MSLRIDLSNLLSSFPMIRPETELEKQLKDQDITLEQYLQNDEAIQCFKDMKPNVKKYFTKEKIKQLIKYITEEPQEDEYNKGYKYPFIAKELLISANERILDMIVLSEDEFLKKYPNETIQNKEDIKKIENDKLSKEKAQSLLENNDIINKEENNKDINNNIPKKEEDKKEEEKEKENIKETKNEDNKNDISTKSEKEENVIEEESKEKINQEQKNDDKEGKQIEQRKLNLTEHNDLLDLLLDYVIKQKTEFNDVLCGYFSSVLITLLNQYPTDIFFYLFLIRPDALEQIVLNSYQKSLSNISIKILNIEQYYNDVNEILKTNPNYIDIEVLNSKKKDFEMIRTNLLEKIIISIDLNGMKVQNGNYLKGVGVSSVFFMLINLVKNINISLSMNNNGKIIKHIFDILEQDIYNNINIGSMAKKLYNYFIIFLIKLLSNIPINEIKNEKCYPEFDYKKIFDKLKKNELLSFDERIIITFPKILVSNFIEINNEKREKKILGIHNIYILDLVKEVFKYLKYKPNLFDFIILETDFIDKSISYFFKYQLNNIYHNKFLQFFTLYLEEADNHLLLTDYIFNKKKFHTLLGSFISQDLNMPVKDNNNNNNIYEYINRYEFPSGKKVLSCMHIHAVDLLYKIQTASGLKILEENDKNDLGILNYGMFEFTRDETTPKDLPKMKLPKYVIDILSESENWKKTVNDNLVPFIKKYENKLCYSKEFRPKEIKKNEISSLDLLNSLFNIISAKKQELNIKKEEPTTNYNDTNFWQVKNSLSDEIKDKVNTNINDNKNDKDEEDELLQIAMKLEKGEKKEENKIPKAKTNVQPKFNFMNIFKKDNNTSIKLTNINQEKDKEKENDIKKEDINKEKNENNVEIEKADK